MISRKAVADFLSRRLRSFNRYKNLKKRALLKKIRELPAKVEFPITPYQHQLVCWYIGIKENSFLFDLDMGAGKTFLSLMIYKYRRQIGQVNKLLIVVPSENNVYGWKEEVQKYLPEYTYQPLLGTKDKRIKFLEKQEADIYAINYAGLSVMMTEFVQKKSKRGQPKKKHRVIADEHVDWFCQFFDMVIFDESHFIKNPKSLVTQIAMEMSHRDIPYRYLLSGTPFSQPIDLWSQFYVMDGGETLSADPEFFYHVFYRKVTTPFGSSWEYDRRMSRDLQKLMRNRSLTYRDHEFSDLPDMVEQIVPCHMHGKQLAAYKNLLRKKIKEESVSITDLENVYAKLRQVASGWLKIKEVLELEEASEEIETIIDYDENPKLEELLALIRTMPSSSKMLVFYQFTHSGEQIMQALKQEKIKAVWLWSGTKNKEQALDTFKNDDDCYVAVCQTAVASTGLNLQHANYTVYYELPDGLIHYKQSKKRTHRSGQKKTCFYYYLLASGSVDYRIYEALSRNEELLQQITSGKVSLGDLLDSSKL